MRIRIATLVVAMYLQCWGSGSGVRYPWIRDPVPLDPGSGMGKKSGSGILDNPDHISESLETIFLVKILDADPGSGMEKIRYPGSGVEKVRIRHLG
jgi:hypothetical protein